MSEIFISDSVAKIGLSLQGGFITSYTLSDGFKLMRSSPQDSEMDSRQGASFVLLPYSNRIENGTLEFAHKSYNIPLNFGDHPHSIHGVGWTSPWQVRSQTQSSICLELDYQGTDWPFPFKAVQELSLSNGALTHELYIENTGESEMPAGLGLHPYFPRHSGAELTADLSHVWMTTDTGIPTEKKPTPETWSFTQSKNVSDVICDHVFERWNNDAVIYWPKEDKKVTITAHSDLDRLVIYIPEGGDTFCVEPVSHMTNAFNASAKGMPLEESGMRVLAPRESWKIWVRFTPS